MKLAIILITCDRENYTRKTLEGFSHFNQRCADTPYPVKLYHVDDASDTDLNVRLAAKYGFETVRRHPSRLGNTATRSKAIYSVDKIAGPSHIMLLENDWESDRALPWEAIRFAMEHKEHDIYHMRLWRYFKSRKKFASWDGRSELVYRGHAGRNRAAPGWQPLLGAPEVLEIGDIHWGAPPAVTRTKEMVWLHEGVSSESESILRSGEITARVAQVTTNVFWHIGEERTPGFRR